MYHCIVFGNKSILIFSWFYLHRLWFIYGLPGLTIWIWNVNQISYLSLHLYTLFAYILCVCVNVDVRRWSHFMVKSNKLMRDYGRMNEWWFSYNYSFIESWQRQWWWCLTCSTDSMNVNVNGHDPIKGGCLIVILPSFVLPTFFADQT